jgi:hypothetical protein
MVEQQGEHGGPRIVPNLKDHHERRMKATEDATNAELTKMHQQGLVSRDRPATPSLGS